MSFTSPEFWIALMQIIGVNIVLSGDNAVVIALAARSLPADQQKRAVAWGSGAAVVMRIALTIVAVELLRLPYLKLVGAALLLWIAVQLLVPEDEGDETEARSSSMASAIKTILLADLVMSLDNVIAVAAAAKGNTVLLIVGLAISIPLVVFASRLLLVLMDRFPIIITLGAALLGWVAGDMAVTDPVVKDWVDLNAPFLHWAAPLAGAIAVVAVGKWFAARTLAQRAAEAPPVEAVPASVTDEFRRVMLAADGSPAAENAARRVIALRQHLRHPDIQVHLINVQRPLSGEVSNFVGGKPVEEYHRERSNEALAPVRALFAAAGISVQEHAPVGNPGPTIARVAHETGCHLIVMGTHGLGSRAGAVLGSVAQSTLEHAGVPVLMVK
ncbi:MAG: YjbE family putative metal transport protein [Burkholderiales bacterium]|nr:YjbE family putative metal transport protein [Burkholderiales bacterium]